MCHIDAKHRPACEGSIHPSRGWFYTARWRLFSPALASIGVAVVNVASSGCTRGLSPYAPATTTSVPDPPPEIQTPTPSPRARAAALFDAGRAQDEATTRYINGSYRFYDAAYEQWRNWGSEGSAAPYGRQGPPTSTLTSEETAELIEARKRAAEFVLRRPMGYSSPYSDEILSRQVLDYLSDYEPFTADSMPGDEEVSAILVTWFIRQEAYVYSGGLDSNVHAGREWEERWDRSALAFHRWKPKNLASFLETGDRVLHARIAERGWMPKDDHRAAIDTVYGPSHADELLAEYRARRAQVDAEWEQEQKRLAEQAAQAEAEEASRQKSAYVNRTALLTACSAHRSEIVRIEKQGRLASERADSEAWEEAREAMTALQERSQPTYRSLDDAYAYIVANGTAAQVAAFKTQMRRSCSLR
jgi:hypothetical protein